MINFRCVNGIVYALEIWSEVLGGEICLGLALKHGKKSSLGYDWCIVSRYRKGYCSFNFCVCFNFTIIKNGVERKIQFCHFIFVTPYSSQKLLAEKLEIMAFHLVLGLATEVALVAISTKLAQTRSFSWTYGRWEAKPFSPFWLTSSYWYPLSTLLLPLLAVSYDLISRKCLSI